MVTTLPGRSYSAADKLARNLGWFSIALGAAQLFAPRQVGRAIGMEEHAGLLRACGVREIMTGVGIIAGHDATPLIWGRVVGDAMDLAALAPALADKNDRRRSRARLAAAVVAAVAVVDLLCAKALSDEKRLPRQPLRDYGDRTGLPRGIEASRGAAALSAPSGEMDAAGSTNAVGLSAGPTP